MCSVIPKHALENLFASANLTRAVAFRQKIYRAFSSRFLQQKKLAKEPDSAWRRFTELSNNIRAGLKSKAPSARAARFAFTFHTSATNRLKWKNRRRKSPFAAAWKP